VHGNFAAMKADLALGPPPAMADAAATAAMPYTGKVLGILAQHVLNGTDPGRQAEALEGTVHILPSHFHARQMRNVVRCGSVRHGVALLCGFDTPSLAAQGEQRLLR
jgi:uncharacterized protein (DUF2342 family)